MPSYDLGCTSAHTALRDETGGGINEMLRLLLNGKKSNFRF